MSNLTGTKFSGEANTLSISILTDAGERLLSLGVPHRSSMFIIACNALFFFRNLLAGGWMNSGDCLSSVLLETSSINFCSLSFASASINLILSSSPLGGLYSSSLLAPMGRTLPPGGCQFLPLAGGLWGEIFVPVSPICGGDLAKGRVVSRTVCIAMSDAGFLQLFCGLLAERGTLGMALDTQGTAEICTFSGVINLLWICALPVGMNCCIGALAFGMWSAALVVAMSLVAISQKIQDNFIYFKKI